MIVLDGAGDRVEWQTVNDVVMGGASRSAFERLPAHKIFTGTLLAEGGGGFASIRRAVAVPRGTLGNAIELMARGDGKQYQFRIRTTASPEGSAYHHDFNPSSAGWELVTMPLAAFRATRRGKPVTGVPAIVADQILQIGCLIAAKQFGPFRLELADIRLLQIQGSRSGVTLLGQN